MSYTYASFQSALALYMAIPQANVATPNFVLALPSIIDYAEQRCYRELDLLQARASWYGTLTPASPAFKLSTGISYPLTTDLPLPLTVERVRILMPTTVPIPPTPGAVTSAVPCTPTSAEFLDAIYGFGSTAGVPVWFSHTSQDFLDFGPPPDQAYVVALFGMYRPFPLYSASPNDGTQTTFLTSFFPDLFLAAAMINAAGYQKNFGAMMDDPKMAQSWETQFNLLLPSAKAEEMRKRFHGWQATTAETNPPPTPQPQPGG
jgi:hypothetical protein